MLKNINVNCKFCTILNIVCTLNIIVNLGRSNLNALSANGTLIFFKTRLGRQFLIISGVVRTILNFILCKVVYGGKR